MATDIVPAISGNVVKNGSSVIYTTTTGAFSTLNTYVKNSPTISNIESKFDARFDDPRYYAGDTRD